MNLSGALSKDGWFGLSNLFRRDTRFEKLQNLRPEQDNTAQLDHFFLRGRIDANLAEGAFVAVAPRIRAARIIFVTAAQDTTTKDVHAFGDLELLLQQVRRLRDEGFEAQVVTLNPKSSVTENGQLIAEMLVRQHCPTWIVTYWKSGLDVLAGLIACPAARRFIEGWVAFQSPFFGTPLADAACYGSRKSGVSAAALGLFGENKQLATEMCVAQRARFMDDHAGAIRQISSQIPVMCVGGQTKLMFLSTVRWMHKMGLESDGVVPTVSSALPGARSVVLAGCGIKAFALFRLFSRTRFEPIDLLKVLFGMLLGEHLKRTRSAA